MTGRESLIACHRCGKSIVYGVPHRVRLQLVNASAAAPPEDVLIEDDFHAECAAILFREAKGQNQ